MAKVAVLAPILLAVIVTMLATLRRARPVAEPQRRHLRGPDRQPDGARDHRARARAARLGRGHRPCAGHARAADAVLPGRLVRRRGPARLGHGRGRTARSACSCRRGGATKPCSTTSGSAAAARSGSSSCSRRSSWSPLLACSAGRADHLRSVTGDDAVLVRRDHVHGEAHRGRRGLRRSRRGSTCERSPMPPVKRACRSHRAPRSSRRCACAPSSTHRSTASAARIGRASLEQFAHVTREARDAQQPALVFDQALEPIRRRARVIA